LPVELTGVNGDVIINADNLSLLVDVSGYGPYPDSIRITDGTNELTLTSTGAAYVALFDETGAPFTPLNPLPVSVVSVSPSSGTPVYDYKSVVNLATSTTDDHNFDVVGSAFTLTQFWASASGNILVELLAGSVGSEDTYGTFFKGANENVDVVLSKPVSLAIGERVIVRILNREDIAQDVFSTVIGEYA
jgi:hypothetical protein